MSSIIVWEDMSNNNRRKWQKPEKSSRSTFFKTKGQFLSLEIVVGKCHDSWLSRWKGFIHFLVENRNFYMECTKKLTEFKYSVRSDSYMLFRLITHHLRRWKKGNQTNSQRFWSVNTIGSLSTTLFSMFHFLSAIHCFGVSMSFDFFKE